MQEAVANAVEDLWVLAKVKDSICAINGGCVESILLLDHEVTPLPNSNDIHIGIIRLRGGIVPIMDLRRVMGMESMEAENVAFEQMLEQRKQDHIRWVKELQRCIKENDEFKLTTDPHQCAFGRWYDNYQPTSQSVGFHLGKIDEPHKKLHATAKDIFSMEHDCDHCTREECLKDGLQRATQEYMPRVLSLLEEAKAVFRNSYHKMVMVLASGEEQRGILVDEVLSAESLASMTESPRFVNGVGEPLVTHIAQRKAEPGQVLIINEARLLQS